MASQSELKTWSTTLQHNRLSNVSFPKTPSSSFGIFSYSIHSQYVDGTPSQRHYASAIRSAQLLFRFSLQFAVAPFWYAPLRLFTGQDSHPVFQIYDYLLTFNAERTLIWPSSWSITKVLFLLTRYAPFIDITIILWRAYPSFNLNNVLTGFSNKNCSNLI